jgi:hypothetical protein
MKRELLREASKKCQCPKYTGDELKLNDTLCLCPWKNQNLGNATLRHDFARQCRGEKIQSLVDQLREPISKLARESQN